MYIDPIESDEYRLNKLYNTTNEINFGNRKAYIHEEGQLPCLIHFETRVKEAFSIERHENQIKPMMHRCTGGSISVKHTDSDGNSIEGTFEITFAPEKPEAPSKETENNDQDDSVEE